MRLGLGLEELVGLDGGYQVAFRREDRVVVAVAQRRVGRLSRQRQRHHQARHLYAPPELRVRTWLWDMREGFKSRGPLPLAGRGLGVGVSARHSRGRNSGSQLAPPSLTPPRKGEGKSLQAYAASTRTTSVSSRAVTRRAVSPVMAAPSRASRRTPLTSSAPVAATR